MSIRESALSLISSISQSDYLRAVTSGGNSRRVTMANAAKAVVEGYSGSSLGGSQRTVKAAIDAMANDVDIINKIAIKNTASGPVASFPDGSDGLPIQSLIADINPVQSGSGTPSPQNIRPISGKSSVDVVRTGKNQLDASGGSGTVSGVTFTYTNGVIVASGNATANVYRVVGTFTPKNGVQYILTGCPSGGANGKYRITLAGYGYDYGSGYTFTGDGQSHNITCDVYTGYPTSGTTLTFKPMIRLATEADSTYEPYTGQSYTTALGRTVYGGTLDVTSGVLTVTHGFITFNGDEEWSLSGSGTSCNYRALASVIKHPQNDEVADILCNRFEAKTDDQVSASTIGISVYSSGYIRVCVDGQATTVSAFKTWLSSNNLQVVYELATPQTYQLTPQQIQTLLGTNNVWANSGDVEVIYIADTKLYIDNH